MVTAQQVRNIVKGVARAPGSAVRGAVNGGFWVAKHTGYIATLSITNQQRFADAQHAVANPSSRASKTIDVVTDAALVGAGLLVWGDNIAGVETAVRYAREGASLVRDGVGNALEVARESASWAYHHKAAVGIGLAGASVAYTVISRRGTVLAGAGIGVGAALVVLGLVQHEPLLLERYIPPQKSNANEPLTRGEFVDYVVNKDARDDRQDAALTGLASVVAGGAASPSTGTAVPSVPTVQPPQKASLGQFVSYSVRGDVLKSVAGRDASGLAAALKLPVQRVRELTDGVKGNGEFVRLDMGPTGATYVQERPDGKWNVYTFSPQVAASITGYLDGALTAGEAAQVAGVRR